MARIIGLIEAIEEPKEVIEEPKEVIEEPIKEEKPKKKKNGKTK